MIAQIRIGQGMDVHAFEEGDFVTFSWCSDSTYTWTSKLIQMVMLYCTRLCDALLGALALG